MMSAFRTQQAHTAHTITTDNDAEVVERSKRYGSVITSSNGIRHLARLPARVGNRLAILVNVFVL